MLKDRVGIGDALERHSPDPGDDIRIVRFLTPEIGRIGLLEAAGESFDGDFRDVQHGSLLSAQLGAASFSSANACACSAASPAATTQPPPRIGAPSQWVTMPPAPSTTGISA